MNLNANESEFNRRDFLRGGSIASLLTMLGGMEIFARAEETNAEEFKGPRVKVAVIGLGAWGREILNTLAVDSVAKVTEVAAICDNYPASLTRAAKLAPGAKQVADYKEILADKDIPAVIIATPTQLHKDITIAALKAGKHVYCEAPIANTIEDAREIARAARDAKKSVFQAGLQLRASTLRNLVVKKFVRVGALGEPVMARAQWNKKTSWRATSPNPEREKALNWRLDKKVSLGLAGELGIHSIDQASWIFNSLPTAVSGFGSLLQWKDGRDVPDTVQAVLEFPGGVNMSFNASLSNSFEGEIEVYCGGFSAIMARDGKAWLFKEVDSPLLGWEVYARKEAFYDEVGIVLLANATASTQAKKKDDAAASGSQTNAPAGDGVSATPSTASAPAAKVNTALAESLERFARNTGDVIEGTDFFITSYGDDPAGLVEHLEKEIRPKLRPTAGYLDGFRAVVMTAKANEAILGNKRLEIKPELYEL